MEWINIKDRMPDRDLLYCIVCDSDDPRVGSITAQYSKERKEFFNILGLMRAPLEGLTHWMPLPEPAGEYDEVD